ncbi:MAG: Ig-like domain-containing protein [Chloroflexota bacterium]
MRRTLSFFISIMVALTALMMPLRAQSANEAVAPQVIDTAPVSGEELPIDGTVSFIFDQAMDQGSVQAALKVSPATQGSLSWSNDTTATFKPATPLQRGIQYTFSVGNGAKSKAGTLLRDVYTARYRTAGFLEVTQMLPANNTANVSAIPAITVIFNRPVVPLGTLDEMAKQPSPITIAPAVDGKGEWTSTSIYTFRPTTGLQGGKKYTVTIKKGLTDVSGATLQNDVVSSFTVASPQAITVTVIRGDDRYVDPNTQNQNVNREAKFAITFSQPMDTASTQAAFSLSANNDKVDGSFEWNAANNKLTFAPKALLNYATQYIVKLDHNVARSAGGSLLDKDTVYPITTIGLPDIVRTQPSNGETTDPYGGFGLEFSVPMKLDNIRSRITFDPPQTTGTSEYTAPDGSFYNTGAGYTPSTNFTVTIDVAGLVDRYGTPIYINPKSSVYTVVAPNKLQVKYTTNGLNPNVILQVKGSPGIYSAYRPSTQLFVAHVNVQQLDLSLFSLPLTDFLNLAKQNGYDAQRTYNPQDLLRHWTMNVADPRDATRYDLVTLSTQGASAALPPVAAFSCPGAPATRLSVGMSAMVTPDDPTPLRIRSAAGLTGAVLTQLKPGIQLDIIGGPTCADGFVWWNIRTKDGSITGWAAEGTPASYFIGPVGQAPAPAVPAANNPSDANAPALTPGAYWLDYNSPQLQGTPNAQPRMVHVLFVATANVTVKVAQKEVLAWVTDLQSGQPVANAAVQFYVGQENLTPLGAPVKTDANGLARQPLQDDQGASRNEVFASVNDGANVGVGSANWSNGIDPYTFNQPVNFDPQSLSVYLYSDRSLYQPGQTVYFKGVVRTKDDVTYGLSPFKTVPVELTNDQNQVLDSREIPVNDYGSFSDSFTIPENGSFGVYRIIVRPGFTGGDTQNYQGPQFSREFDIAQYRLPEYQVTLNAEKPQVVQGDTIKVTVDSAYFFGGAVKNANVDWNVLSNNYSFNYTGNGRYRFIDQNDDEGLRFFPDYRGYVAKGTGKTDDQGKLTIEIPADLGNQKTSQTFSIEARVTDVSDQTIAGTLEVTVHQGEFYIGVAPENYVGTANQLEAVNLISVDWDSKPKPNTDLTVKVVQRVWVTEQTIDPQTGEIKYKSTVKEDKLAESLIKTDADGKASYSFTPTGGGIYKIYATSQDSHNNQITSSAYLWVAGPGYVPWRADGDRIDLKTDRDSYKIGDTASILIPSPFQGATKALITVERGKVLRSEVVDLTSNSTIYKVPITPDLAPNAFVSVLLVKGPDANTPAAAYRFGLTGFTVDAERLKLNIAVTADKPQASPGETVTYKVKVTDYENKPVQAEVGLGLTDAAVLSVKPDTSTPIADYFYATQGIAVRTGTALTLNVDGQTEQIRAQLDALNKLGPTNQSGGGGGGGGGGEGAPIQVRQKFVDTPLWEPFVKTDANGEATVSVTLPDNLTQWRLDARADTTPTGELNTTLVGQTTFDLISTKPLLIRPVTPRFYVVGDVGTLAAIVNNNTGADQDVKVRLEAKGVTVKTNVEQTAKIASGDQMRFEWQVEVQDVESVDATFSAATADNKFTDAAKSTAGQGDDRTLPVVRYEVPENIGTGGSIRKEGGTQTEGVAIPPRLNTAQGTLDIRVDPSLAASAVSALDVLANEPLQDTQQTVSRFLPNLMTYRALKKLGIDNATMRDDLTKTIDFAIQKLEAEQHQDGGWGWFVTNDSDPLVSGYTIIGLGEAKKDGFKVDQDSLNRAINFVVKSAVPNINANTPGSQLNRQAFLYYALARAGYKDAGAVRLIPLREKLSIYARAYLAMTLHMLNAGDTASVNTALADFQTKAITSATGVHWQEDTPDSLNWNTDTRTTAIVLETLIELQPTSPIIPDVVRWLMVARSGDAWQTPQETAWAVMSLTNWMQITGELKPNYTFGVTLNDKALVSDQKATPETVEQQVKLQVAVKDLLSGQTNRLVINRSSGDGVLYYTAHLKAYLPVDQLQPVSRGLTVTRTYSLMSDPDHTPITQAKVGDAIRVTLNIIAPNDLNYLVINDPIPAGTEGVNPDLATTGTIGQPPDLHLDDPLAKGWGYWWFSNTELRFDRTVLYASFLPKGSYQFTYTVQANLAGQYRVIPTTGQEVYFPETYARSASAIFTVLPKDAQ